MGSNAYSIFKGCRKLSKAHSKVIADAGYEIEKNYLFLKAMDKRHLSNLRITKYQKTETIEMKLAG